MRKTVSEKVFAAERTRQAIASAESGDIDDARTLLAEALTLDPGYELAWLWFAAVTDDVGEERFCLEQVRELDPQHRSIPALDRLATATAKQPPELAPIIDPPPPDFVSGYAQEVREARRQRIIRRLLIVATVLAVVGAALLVFSQTRVKYSYLAIVVSDRAQAQLGGGESIAAAQWAVDDWNTRRADSSQQLQLVSFVDDGDPGKAAEVAREIVADNRFVGVIGHDTSATSEAAAPIYEQAGIPAITPFATADSVTRDRPWYFRTIFDNTEQGTGMANYAIGVEEKSRAVSVSADDPYGQTLRVGFLRGLRSLDADVVADIVVSSDPTRRTADLRAAARQIARMKDPGAIALSMHIEDSEVFFDELDRHKVLAPVIVPDALASTDFYRKLGTVSAARVNNTLAATPLADGSLIGPAVNFYDQFSEAVGYQPSWGAGLTYDAVMAFAESMLRSDVAWGTDDLVATRTGIRDFLSTARTPNTSIPTLTGDLYFDDDGSAVRPVQFNVGRTTRGGVVTVESAPYQMTTYSPQAGVSLAEQLRSGWAFRAQGDTFTIQRVVTTGFNINQISELDPATQTFSADFFIWLKYEGSDQPPSDIRFANAVDPTLSLGEPQRQSHRGKQNYVLYEVRGTFHATMQFNDFPFDRQNLPITIQNNRYTAAQLNYVPDPDNLDQTQLERLQSGTDADATIDEIPNWQADSVSFYPGSVGNTGALGDPTLTKTEQGVTYSQLSASTAISRDVTSFLIKNLLPLILLTIVTYVSLWYPYKDATSRISFGVTGILTGAVMLNSVTNSLPSVDYTVAIEWAYYAFICLSGVCILSTLIGRHLTETRQLSRVRTLDRVMRVGYPVAVIAVAMTYWVTFT
ncbi:MAG: ABC transporter substrate-binding protein [Candidatus Nanopelagicales bacterium]